MTHQSDSDFHCGDDADRLNQDNLCFFLKGHGQCKKKTNWNEIQRKSSVIVNLIIYSHLC